MMHFSLATSPEFLGQVHPDDALLIEALVRRGHQTAQLEWGHAPKADAVLLRTTWDYYRHLDQFIDWARQVEEHCPLMNPAAVVEWNCNKFYLEEIREADVLIPATHFVRTPEDIARWEPQGKRWVVKPDVSANSWETLATNDHEEARAQVRRILALGRRALVQAYLPAIETGEYSMVFFAGEYSHSVLKTPASGDFRVQDDHGGTVKPVEPRDDLLEAARIAIAAVPFDTLVYARCDLVDTPRGPALMELELIEPELFTRFADGSAARFADAIERNLERS